MSNDSRYKDDDRVTMNISLSQSERQFLKIYSARRNSTVSGVIQKYIKSLRRREMKRLSADSDKVE